MAISLNRVSANVSAPTGVFPQTHGVVGVDVLLWDWAKCLLHKHMDPGTMGV